MICSFRWLLRFNHFTKIWAIYQSFLNGGENIEMTNIWIGSYKNIGTNVYSGVEINGSENISIANAYIRGYGGHGVHLHSGNDIYMYNFMIGRNGKDSLGSSGCDYDGIRVENSVNSVVLRGGTSGNLYKGTTNHQQGFGLSVVPNNNVFVKGVDLHNNCTASISGTPNFKQFNPGLL